MHSSEGLEGTSSVNSELYTSNSLVLEGSRGQKQRIIPQTHQQSTKKTLSSSALTRTEPSMEASSKRSTEDVSDMRSKLQTLVRDRSE